MAFCEGCESKKCKIPVMRACVQSRHAPTREGCLKLAAPFEREGAVKISEGGE